MDRRNFFKIVSTASGVVATSACGDKQPLIPLLDTTLLTNAPGEPSLWNQLRRTHLAPIEWRVEPRLPLPVAELQHDLDVQAPPLIKGYLRCGAKVLGAPAWDPDFNTADLPMLLRIDDLPARYRKHFLGS